MNKYQNKSMVATAEKKHLENYLLFQVREKSGNFVFDWGSLKNNPKNLDTSYYKMDLNFLGLF